MGFSAPTGDAANSNGHAIFTPTIAGGKGWGNFDIQSTLGSFISQRRRGPFGDAPGLQHGFPVPRLSLLLA